MEKSKSIAISVAFPPNIAVPASIQRLHRPKADRQVSGGKAVGLKSPTCRHSLFGVYVLMMIDLVERSAWNSAICLALVGPGGAGKSSLGLELAPLLERSLVDLDIEFQRRVGDISAYIHHEGYARYKLTNSRLASDIVGDIGGSTILVTSSGFLTLDNPPQVLEANQRLVAGCYSVCLLPSRDIERAVSIIVERQMTRPFSRDRAKEEATIRDRYAVYARGGDMTVFSTASSAETARAIALKLSEN